MPGVTAAGFVRKLEADIIADMLAECRARVDSEYDDSPDSVTGQILAIVASKHAESYEVMEAVWGALSENASGANLDRISALTNTFRKANETDAQLRIRRRFELSDQGTGTDHAMRAALSKLAGMQAVRVISNRSLSTQLPSNRPGKSVESIVLGTATEANVVQTIWQNLPCGIETWGTSTSAVTDSEGNTQTIRYSIAQPESCGVRIVAEVDEGSFAGIQAIKDRVNAFTSGALSLAMNDGSLIAGGVDIEGTLWRSRVAAAALSVSGVIAVPQVLFKRQQADVYENNDRQLLLRTYLGTGPLARGFELAHIEVEVT